ncbi:MAG: hypothetical protein MUC77_20350 [Chromatiaceae bacterium]|jgi:hypothetical protein|nr:hypothetical protein [Chromatiaceae bacterium]
MLARAGRYRIVREPGQSQEAPAPLAVKQVLVADRRYVVCRNADQAKKDAADRAAIVAALREQLKHGDKSLIGNRGYRKYLKGQGPHFQIDEAKLKAEARYDGKWVLRTNTDLPAEEVALKYKQLWQVEALFRATKSLLETRPIFHQRDETIRGHVFCSFLALILRKALLDRFAAPDTPTNGPMCSEISMRSRKSRSSTRRSVFVCAPRHAGPVAPSSAPWASPYRQPCNRSGRSLRPPDPHPQRPASVVPRRARALVTNWNSGRIKNSLSNLS